MTNRSKDTRPVPAPPRFRSHVPFLMNQIISRVHMSSIEEFRLLGFSPQAARVLITVLQYPGANVSRLAEITTIDDSRLSRMLRHMAGQKLLQRRREDVDNRYVTVHLTAEGTRAAMACKAASDKHEARMLKGLSSEDVANLRSLLGRVFETIRSEQWVLSATKKTA
jgi:DNA-binding MarR family transcriptional regulator